MKVKDLIPLLPKYTNDSENAVTINYYNATINYKARNRNGLELWDSFSLGCVEHCEKWLIHPFESAEEILECEVESLEGSRGLIGGGVDERLQIYLSTEKYMK